jgi:hypothetical protein
MITKIQTQQTHKALLIEVCGNILCRAENQNIDQIVDQPDKSESKLVLNLHHFRHFGKYSRLHILPLQFIYYYFKNNNSGRKTKEQTDSKFSNKGKGTLLILD